MTIKSAIFIAPAAARDIGNAFGEAMGWGQGVFSVRLSGTGAEPVTHFGARADIGIGVQGMLDNPPPGAPPFVVLTDDITPLPVLPAEIIVHTRVTSDPYQHFLDVAGSQGLAPIQETAL